MGKVSNKIVMDYDELTDNLAEECHRFISEIASSNSSTIVMEMSFLSKFIGILAFSALTKFEEANRGIKNTESRADAVHAEWSRLKFSLQEHIGIGVAAGMEEFTGKFMDYTCKITPVAAPISEELN